jgi:hypothetical protein
MSGLRAELSIFTNVAQAHIRVRAERKNVLFAANIISQLPKSAACCRDQQSQAVSVAQFVRFCLTDTGVGEVQPGIANPENELPAIVPGFDADSCGYRRTNVDVQPKILSDFL